MRRGAQTRGLRVKATVIAWLAQSIAGCTSGPAVSRPKEVRRAAPNESDACARCREALDGCGGPTAPCDERCEAAAREVREGFMPAFAGCIEGALIGAACEKAREKGRAGREELARLCYVAAASVLVESDAGATLAAVSEAICARRARCEAMTTEATKSCVASLTVDGRTSRQWLALIPRPALASLIACVGARECGDVDPVVTCANEQNRRRESP
jgi:hypothetical protein